MCRGLTLKKNLSFSKSIYYFGFTDYKIILKFIPKTILNTLETSI